MVQAGFLRLKKALMQNFLKRRRKFQLTNHALLSPSSANRWIHCPPSVLLEEQFEDTTTQAAEEGTVAHSFCEYKLNKALLRKATRPTSDYDCDEMQRHTDSYVDFVLEQLELAKHSCKDPLVLVEQRVDFSAYVKDGFGTADCLIVADDMLHVIDFKYGQGVLVDAYENPQMKCYALGALSMYEDLYAIQEIRMTIFQPRRDNVSTFKTNVSALKTWAEEVLKPSAELALTGEGDYDVGEWCRFCKARAFCRKRAEENLKLAEKEFKEPSLLTDSEITELLQVIPNLTKWANDVIAYATDMAVNRGKVWEGFKLVEGRSIRKYKDENEVIKQAKAHGYTDIFKTSLITLTEMQKLMGKKQFDEILGDLVIKAPGKLTLVPSEDKRQEVILTNAKNEFNVE